MSADDEETDDEMSSNQMPKDVGTDRGVFSVDLRLDDFSGDSK